MATSDSVFEIREYLDGNGRVSGHDVLDISKELEFMAKLCGEMEQSSQGDVNDDDKFIRELALLSDSKDGDDIIDDGTDFLAGFDEPEPNMAASAAHQGKPGGGTVSQNKNKNKSSTATSGWKKGFFGQSFTATGKTKSNVKAHADADIIEDNNKLKQAEGSSSLPNISAESTTAPILSTTSSTTGTAAAAHTAVKFALPADDASTTLTTPAVDTAGQAPQPQTAFSGSIFERTPAGPTLPLPGGGAAGGHKLLGPKARLGGKMS